MERAHVAADVRISDRLDAVFLTPRSRDNAHELMQSVRGRTGPIQMRVTANGVMVPAHVAHRLTQVADFPFNWTAEARRFVSNRERARGAHTRLLREVQSITGGTVDEARRRLAGVSGVDVLDPHQVINVAAMTVDGGYGLCVFDEQGVGKTVTCIYAIDTLISRDEVDVILIVAPKSMVAEWPKDFERFRAGHYKVAVLSGSRKAKADALTAGADVFITNFETVVQLEEELQGELARRRGRCALVVDESFFIKSLDAQRTRALRRLREWCGRAYVLCGTPAPNRPHDLVQQFSIVDFGITFDGVEIPDERAAAAPIVRAAMDEKGLYVRNLKADVLPDLPAKRFNRVHVPMAPDQQRLYEGALRNLILDLNATDDAGFRRRIASFFAQRSALLQLCSAPQALSPEYTETPSKLVVLDQLLEELIARRGEKVVVWSFYTASVEAIVHRYERYGAVRYDGAVADVAERREAVRRFQEDDQTMLFVANPAAAGAGLTLHRARYAIYESLSGQAAQYLQSLDRVHRRGQEREVEIVVLLCDQTIEVAEYERLLGKERLAQDLLGDAMQEVVTRESLLAEAEHALRILAEAT
jgi:SNF2 family DNA or RNA helicase